MATTGSNNIFLNTPQTKEQKLAFFQNQVVPTYIAPPRNKHTFSSLSHDQDNSFYYTNYNYDDETINEKQQVVVIHDKTSLYWQDIVVEG